MRTFTIETKMLTILSLYFLLDKNTPLSLLSFLKVMKDPIQTSFYLFTSRSEANGTCLFSDFSIAMCGDNRYVNDLRILRAIELYVNPGFYSQQSIFTLLLHNNLGVFNSVDTILTISFSHNALDTNKTKAELVQRVTLNIYSAYGWCGILCVLALSSVSLSTVQFYYKFSGLSLKYRLMFNQLIQSHLANYLSSEKIHLLFCSNIFEPPLHLVTMTMHLLSCVLGKTPQIGNVKSPHHRRYSKIKKVYSTVKY